MGREAVGPVCCVMHVKEPRTLIVKEKGLGPVFLVSTQQGGYVHATNLIIIIISIISIKMSQLFLTGKSIVWYC